jgi:septum formation topological specificity factor MinE
MFGKAATGSASSTIAKDRLSIILASQRGSETLEGVNMEALNRDVLEVVKVRIINVMF